MLFRSRRDSLGVSGLLGVVYAFIVIRRMRKQSAYQPVLEDWLFHAVLPLVAYLFLAISSFAAIPHARLGLFGVAGASLLLLYIGIHNAWDSVAYHVLVRMASTAESSQDQDRQSL